MRAKKVYSLEKQHKLRLTNFESTKQKITESQNKLRSLLDKDGNGDMVPPEHIYEVNRLREDIKQLSKQYMEKKSEYFERAGVVLHEYYKKDLVINDNNEVPPESIGSSNSSTPNMPPTPSGMIANFIKHTSTSKKKSCGYGVVDNHGDTIGHDGSNGVVFNNGGITGSGKKTLLDQYMSSVSDDYELTNHEVSKQGKCVECNSEMSEIRNDAEIVCVRCGSSGHLIIDSDRKSYKDAPPDMVYYAYKRMNHFNELMQQFQGKETNIPTEVYKAIRDDLGKKQFKDFDNLTPKFMRSVLKKLHLSNYYANIPHIIHKLNGKPILILTPEQDNQLRQMFTQLQEPFRECCPDDRSNWPHYHYTFYKMFELLGLDQFLHCFPKLKNPYLVYNMDKIWKCMCTKLNWQFIQTGRD